MRGPLLFTAVLALCGTAVLPVWYTGTASMGPGGVIDLGTADACGNAPGSVGDPLVCNTAGPSTMVQAANNGTIELVNCLSSGCSGGNQQHTASVSASKAVWQVPLYAVPSPSASPAANPTFGPVAACYQPDGTPCSSGWHSTFKALSGITIASDCAPALSCQLSSNTVSFSGNARFDSQIAYGCAGGMQGTNNTVPVIEEVDGSNIAIALYNISTATIAKNSTYGVTFTCHGY